MRRIFLRLAACCGLAASVVALAQTAPEADAGGAIDVALARLERGARPLMGARIAMVPVVASEEADKPLATAVGARIVERLRADGFTVLDAGVVQELQDAERCNVKGARPNVTIEMLACAYVDVQAFISAEIRREAATGERTLTLRVAEARAEKPLAEASVVIPAGATLPAPEGAKPSAPSALAEPAVTIDPGLFVQRRRPDGTYSPPERWKGERLKRGDRFQLYIRPVKAGHLCVVAYESDGGMRRFFPLEADAKLENAKVQEGAWVKIPAREGNYWYPLGDPPGTDTYFVVAERDPDMIPRLLPVRSVAAERTLVEKPAGSGKEAPPKAGSATEAGAKGTDGRLARSNDLFEGETRRLRIPDLVHDLVALVDSTRDETRLRSALASIRAGEDLPVVPRKAAPEVLGSDADVVSPDGTTTPFKLHRVAGSVRVVESFAITYD
jgi:hypothetical protein